MCAGPKLLAHVAFPKYVPDLSLHRQTCIFQRDLASTLRSAAITISLAGEIKHWGASIHQRSHRGKKCSLGNHRRLR